MTAPAAADARGVVVDFPGTWTTHPMTHDGAVALIGQFWHAIEGAVIFIPEGYQPTAEEIAKSEEAGRIAKAIEQHVIAMLSMPFATDTPSPADGERVSVDAAALETLRTLVFSGSLSLPAANPYIDRAVDAIDALIATARPLPTAAGAVDLSALGEIRAVADTLSVCGSGTGATKMRQMATALRAACDALASATPAVPAPDRAAVEAAVDVVIDSAYWKGVDEARGNKESAAAWARDVKDDRAALLALVFPDAPAHDADAAGEAVRDV